MKLKEVRAAKVANNTETAPLKWITFSTILTLPLHFPKIMYKISVVAFCNRLAFCIISVSEEMGEVVLEPLVDSEEAIAEEVKKQYHKGIYSSVVIISNQYHSQSVTELLLQYSDMRCTVNKEEIIVR